MEDTITMLQDYLKRSAERLPDKVALVCGDQRLTYAEIAARSDRLAASLRGWGVERNDRVVIFSGNSVEAVIAFWGVLKAGAVVSLINPLTKLDKLTWYLNDCQARALICPRSLLRVVDGALRRSPSVRVLVVAEQAAPAVVEGWGGRVAAFDEAAGANGHDGCPRPCGIDEDLAAIIYTSGSTGRPKGVMMSHRNMVTAARSVSSYLEMAADEIVINVLPISFDYGLYQLLMTFRVGGRLVLEPSFALMGDVLRRVVDEKVTGFPGVPMVFSLLADFEDLERFDLSGLRFVTNTAAALSPKHIAFMRRTFNGARIYSMYGLTECKRCTYLPPEDLERKPNSVGVAIPNTELWLVDEHDRRLGPGEVGQLVIRGGTVMRGYWQNEAATAKRLRPGPLPGERVLYTGDLCQQDEEGYLYFVGRTDDIIKSRGEKVAPKEVENVVHALPGVRDAAVIGVDDEVLGQAVKVFVVPHRGAAIAAREVLAGCSRHLESYMVPKYVEIVPDLPRSANGKIRKTELR